MEKAYNSYLKKFPNLVVNYGFNNVEEFVSEVVSNPDFRAALITQQESLKEDKNFLRNMIEKITNFLKGLYTDVPSLEEIDSIINNYLDHLVETRDMPVTQGEYDLRFRNEKFNPNGVTDLERFPELQKFVTSLIRTLLLRCGDRSHNPLKRLILLLETLVDYKNVSLVLMLLMLKIS